MLRWVNESLDQHHGHAAPAKGSCQPLHRHSVQRLRAPPPPNRGTSWNGGVAPKAMSGLDMQHSLLANSESFGALWASISWTDLWPGPRPKFHNQWSFAVHLAKEIQKLYVWDTNFPSLAKKQFDWLLNRKNNPKCHVLGDGQATCMFNCHQKCEK